MAPRLQGGPAKAGGARPSPNKPKGKSGARSRKELKQTIARKNKRIQKLRGGGGGGGEAVEPAEGEKGYVEPDTGTTSMLRAQGKSYAAGKTGIGNYKKGTEGGGEESGGGLSAGGGGGGGGKGKAKNRRLRKKVIRLGKRVSRLQKGGKAPGGKPKAAARGRARGKK